MQQLEIIDMATEMSKLIRVCGIEQIPYREINDGWYTIEEVAKQVGVNKRSVYEKLRNGITEGCVERKKVRNPISHRVEYVYHERKNET